MSAFVTRTLCVGLALFGLAACVYHAAIPPLSPGAQGVRVAETDPPAGATLIGKLQGSNGQGCGLLAGGRGTEAGATAAIKEEAARHGADFVKLTGKKQPYSGHDCFHQEFTLLGVGYRVAPAASTASATVVVAPPVEPAALVSSAVSASSSTPAPSSAPSPAVSAVLAECAPPCSPGYGCNAGVCLALCNPACGPQQRCRADRVCVSATP